VFKVFGRVVRIVGDEQIWIPAPFKAVHEFPGPRYERVAFIDHPVHIDEKGLFVTVIPLLAFHCPVLSIYPYVFFAAPLPMAADAAGPFHEPGQGI